MNIDLNKSKEEFIKYISNYELENKNIDRKKYHSFRVMEISKQIATNMNLDKEEIELATLIGLLHDIARFEQYKQFKTFKDLDSFDHGDYAVGILEKDIRRYVNTDKYDEIIKKSIKNHNKFEIEEGLTQEELLFAKIIRDADKTDIIYESINIFFKGKEEQVNKSILSENVYNQFKNKSIIKREKNIKLENIDNIISVIAFIYDINFKETFEIIKENDYINKIINRYNLEDKGTKEKVEEIRTIANEFIELNCKKG